MQLGRQNGIWRNETTTRSFSKQEKQKGTIRQSFWGREQKMGMSLVSDVRNSRHLWNTVLPVVSPDTVAGAGLEID